MKSVAGDALASAYYAGLVGEADLTKSDYTAASVMAEQSAQRRGMTYQLVLSPVANEPREAVLTVSTKEQEGYKSTVYAANVSNYGTRFAGDQMLGLSAAHNFGSEVQGRFGLQQSIGGDKGDYRMLSAAFDKPTRWGLYGVELSGINFDRSIAFSGSSVQCTPVLVGLLGQVCQEAVQRYVLKEEGRFNQFSLTGSQVLNDLGVERWLASQKLSYVSGTYDQEITDGTNAATGNEEEKYGLLDVGVSYSKQFLAYDDKGAVSRAGSSVLHCLKCEKRLWGFRDARSNR